VALVGNICGNCNLFSYKSDARGINFPLNIIERFIKSLIIQAFYDTIF